MIEKRTFGGIVADIIIWIIVGALALSCLMPLMNIVAISLSDNAAVSANLVNIFPIGFNISSYQEIMGDKQFWRSFGISVLRVAEHGAFTDPDCRNRMFASSEREEADCVTA